MCRANTIEIQFEMQTVTTANPSTPNLNLYTLNPDSNPKPLNRGTQTERNMLTPNPKAQSVCRDRTIERQMLNATYRGVIPKRRRYSVRRPNDRATLRPSSSSLLLSRLELSDTQVYEP